MASISLVPVGAKGPQPGLLAQFEGLWPSFWALGPVSGPSPPPQVGDTQTDKLSVSIYEYDKSTYFTIKCFRQKVVKEKRYST